MIIGIIGIGLIGSSLARAFKGANAGSIYIADIDKTHLEQAQGLGLGDRYFTAVQELAPHCDVVFISVPVKRTAEVAREIAPHLKPGAVVTDVGSVKSAVIRETGPCFPPNVAFVPGHPIAGTEQSGPRAGRADLFAGRTYALIGDEKDPAVIKVADLVKKTGARIAYMDADKHDLILGFTSHLPHLCAFAAVHSAKNISARTQENIMRYTGGSFEDLTRIAGSNVDMWRDIFLSNKEHIAEAYKLLRQELDRLATLIENADATGINDYIGEARELRYRYYDDKRRDS